MAVLAYAQPEPRQEGRLVAVLRQYRFGDADAAIRDFSRWEERDVESLGHPTATVDPWDDAALALLCTEAAQVRGDWEPPHWGEKSGTGMQVTSARSRTASALVDRLARQSLTKEDGLADFVLSWYALFVRSSLTSRETVRLLSENPRGLLVLERAEEDLMGPESLGGPIHRVVGEDRRGPGILSTSSGRYDGGYATTVEKRLRQALALSPKLVEARVRLGFVLSLFDRYDDAVRELERGRRDAAGEDPDVNEASAYLSMLFLAEIAEARGNPSEARKRYEDAIGQFPSGQAAFIGLARTSIALGQSADGWATLRDATARQWRPDDGDPWYFYRPEYATTNWHQSARMGRLRAMVRGEVPAVTRPSADRLRATAMAPLEPARQSASASQELIYRAGTDAVQIDAFVTQNAEPVEGLTAHDFIVRDNGRDRDVADASRVTRLSAVLLVDGSSSMRARQMWPKALDVASIWAAALQPTDRAAVATFGGQTMVVQPLAEARGLMSGLDGLRTIRIDQLGADSTSLYDAVFGAAALVVGEERPVVVLISDMADNTSWLFNSNTLESRRSKQYREAFITALRSERVIVDTVFAERPKGVSDWSFGPIDTSFLSSETGGKARFIGATDLSAYVEQRVKYLRSGYLLRYDPRPCSPGEHRVSVRLRTGRATVNGTREYQCDPR